MMNVERPLFWYQGVFLQPQHFQLQERAASSALIPFLKYRGPHFWGVGSLHLDDSALNAGTFSLRSGAFLFRDGTYVEVPGNGLPVSRSVDPGLLQGKALRVYLGLRKWNDAGENVTVVERPDQGRGAETRFVATADPEDVNDLHARGAVGQVKRLHFLLKLFWETERDAASEYLLIPIARLEVPESAFASPKFIPPSLVIGAVEPLSRLVREIRDELVARGRQLEQCQKKCGAQKGDTGYGDLVHLLALRTVGRIVPLLDHQAEGAAVHPWEVYGALRQLVGELSVLSSGVYLFGETGSGDDCLPPYDHCDLWGCFSAARSLLSRLLADITAGPDHVIRLVRNGGRFSADLNADVLQPGYRYFLAIRTEDAPTASAALESVAKLSASEHLPILASRALPGLPLEALLTPPPELPRSSRTLYFAIDHTDPQWGLVSKGRNLALHWDLAPDDLEVELLVVAAA